MVRHMRIASIPVIFCKYIIVRADLVSNLITLDLSWEYILGFDSSLLQITMWKRVNAEHAELETVRLKIRIKLRTLEL